MAEICAAGAIPVILGGDHSVAVPDMTAVAEHHGLGTVGVIHFDAHADTASALHGFELSHGSPMRLVVDNGAIRGDRFIQLGLRGWWPEEEEFSWMRANGFRWYTMYELDERGFIPCLDEAIAAAGEREHAFLSVDIDSLDPAYAPGTGTPEIGGLTTRELGLAASAASPPSFPLWASSWSRSHRSTTPTGMTAVNAHRLVLEALSGLGLRRSGRAPAPQLDSRAR